MNINHVSTGRYRKKPVEIEALQYTGYNHGEYYPCKPDIFEMTYESVREDL